MSEPGVSEVGVPAALPEGGKSAATGVPRAKRPPTTIRRRGGAGGCECGGGEDMPCGAAESPEHWSQVMAAVGESSRGESGGELIGLPTCEGRKREGGSGIGRLGKGD